MEPLLAGRGGGGSDGFQDFADLSSDGGSDWGDGDADLCDESVLQLLSEASSSSNATSSAPKPPTLLHGEATPAHETEQGLFPASERGGDTLCKQEEARAAAGDRTEALLDQLFPAPATEELVAETFAAFHGDAEAKPAKRPTHSTDSGSGDKPLSLYGDLAPRDEPPTAVHPLPETDCVSLLEEMYGDAAIRTLSSTPTPPPAPTPRGWTSLDTDKRVAEQVASHVEASPRPETSTVDATSPLSIPRPRTTFTPELLAALQQVHDAATAQHVTLWTLLGRVQRALCLPSDVHAPAASSTDSPPDVETLATALDALERQFARRSFVQSFAPTRGERLELVLVALDASLGVLPSSWRAKWAKTLATLPLLVQLASPGPKASSVVHTAAPEPPASTTGRASPRSCRSGSPLQGWATFSPDKMPVRCRDAPKAAVRVASAPQTSNLDGSGARKLQLGPHVLLRPHRPPRLRVRRQTSTMETPESSEPFATRMQKDIRARRLQRQQRDETRARREQQEAQAVAAASLVDSGSQRLLQRSGRWEESMAQRLRRLALRHTGESSKTRDKKKRRRDKRQQRAAERTARACDSLYARGLAQRQREEARREADTRAKAVASRSAQLQARGRSLRVMQRRIRHELARLCADSRRACGLEQDDKSDGVTFVAFSCALLFFGLVPSVDAAWRTPEDAPEASAPRVTQLWHAWQVLAGGASRLAVARLERLLFAVLLGAPAACETRAEHALLELLRVNYRARPRAPQRLAVSCAAGHATSTHQDDAPRAPARRGRQRAHYSLHGRRLQAGASASDPLSERQAATHARVHELRRAQQRQELVECTFRPRISRLSRAKPPREPPRELPRERPPSSTFERLYCDAFARQQHVLDAFMAAKRRREAQHARRDAVRASHVNGRSVEQRVARLQAALASNALPVDFHKKVAAMRRASERTTRDEQLAAQRLTPARFAKTRDGRCTIVRPFHLATAARAAQEDEQRRVLQATTRQTSRQTPSCRVDDADEPLVCLDVHVSASERHELRVYVGDEPDELVAQFAAQHSLVDASQRRELLQAVRTQLRELLELRELQELAQLER